MRSLDGGNQERPVSIRNIDMRRPASGAPVNNTSEGRQGITIQDLEADLKRVVREVIDERPSPTPQVLAVVPEPHSERRGSGSAGVVIAASIASVTLGVTGTLLLQSYDNRATQLTAEATSQLDRELAERGLGVEQDADPSSSPIFRSFAGSTTGTECAIAAGQQFCLTNEGRGDVSNDLGQEIAQRPYRLRVDMYDDTGALIADPDVALGQFATMYGNDSFASSVDDVECVVTGGAKGAVVAFIFDEGQTIADAGGQVGDVQGGLC